MVNLKKVIISLLIIINVVVLSGCAIITNDKQTNSISTSTFETATDGPDIIENIPELNRQEVINDLIDVFQTTSMVDFDFFDSYVIINGVKIKGIAFTNYSEGYQDKNTNEIYICAGFIRYDNVLITSKDIENGLIINAVSDFYKKFTYIYAYPAFSNINSEIKASSFIPTHYIHNNHYISWDIKNDKLECFSTPYRGVDTIGINDEKGNIYNYDKNEYSYIIENMPFVPTSGVSLANKTYNEDFVKLLNEILKTQSLNFEEEELRTYIGQAEESIKESIINSMMLNDQQETFMGYTMDQLEDFFEKVDPYNYMRIIVDVNGNQKIELISMELISTWQEKLLTSFSCALGFVTGILCKVGAKLTIAIPALPLLFSTIGEALVSTSKVAFTEIVVKGHGWDEKTIQRVSTAAIIGGFTGLLCGALPTKYVSGKVSDIIDKLLGGAIEIGLDIVEEFVDVTAIDKNEYTILNGCLSALNGLTAKTISGIVSGVAISNVNNNLLNMEKFPISLSKYILVNKENIDFLRKLFSTSFEQVIDDVISSQSFY